MSRSSTSNSFVDLLQYLEARVDFLYSDYEEFLELVNELSKKKMIDINKKVKKWEKANASNGTLDRFRDIELSRVANFGSTINFSSIIQIYSKFEFELKFICDEIAINKDKKIRSSDINGKGIFQYKHYLEKVFEINFKSLSVFWDEIENYNRLRNLIVHHNGVLVIKDNQNLSDLKAYHDLSGLQGCKVYSNGIVSINMQTVSQFIKVVNNVLWEILLKLKEQEKLSQTKK